MKPLTFIPKERADMDCEIQKPMNDLMLRLITVLCSAPIVVFIIHHGPPYVDLLASLVALGLLREWNRLVTWSKAHIGFLLGVLYICSAVSVLVFFGHKSIQHKNLLLWLLVVVWATDIGAYAVGKTFKGPKLWKRISPNKTWSGFGGGLLSACLFGFLVNRFIWPIDSLFGPSLLTMALVFSVGAHVGDLLESWMKRYFGVKDAGNLLPGHGGLLDRLDSLLFVALMAGLFYWVGIIH